MNRTLVRGRLFSRLVIDDTGCLLWTGYKDTCGYGRVKINQRAHSVHRLMYELFVGEIPDGMEIDHLCRVRHCASPAHLEVVTHAENLRRAEMPDRKGVATHCKAGHEFDLLNTYYRTNGNRRCRTCDRERDRPSRRRAASGDGQPLTVAAVTPELAEAMGEIADAAQEPHEHSFPVQPPHGSLTAPGPCACGKTWAVCQAERELAAALAALTVARREAGDE